jgi:hypothetical protein
MDTLADLQMALRVRPGSPATRALLAAALAEAKARAADERRRKELALRRATIDMAEYLGEDQQLGSIERGKLADFLLVPGDPTASLSELKNARMVMKDGVVYFPSELYPRFGIQPFSTAPAVQVPQATPPAN